MPDSDTPDFVPEDDDRKAQEPNGDHNPGMVNVFESNEELPVGEVHSPSNADSTDKTIREVALEVLSGEWGSGQEKRNRLAMAGFDPNEVHQETIAVLNENN